MKKAYNNPTIKIVELKVKHNLLMSGSLGKAYNSSDVSYSRQRDYDDEDEW